MDYRQIERIYKALGNRRRLAIIDYLNKKEKAPVNDIADFLNLSFKSTSKHLQLLKNAGFLENTQTGLSQYYFLKEKNNPLIKQVLSLL